MCQVSHETSGQTMKSSSSNSTSSSFSPRLMGSIAALGIALACRTVPGVTAVLRLVGYFALSLVMFIVSLIWFVNFRTSKALRKPCPTAGPIAEVDQNILPKNALSDLDKIANSEGLNALWKKEIQSHQTKLTILLTGVTGYVGRAFLFQLLREIALAEKDGKKLGHKVYVMARGKARKNLSAGQRLEKIRDEPMFAPYKQLWNEVIMAAESGDLQESKCGMSQDTLNNLQDANITHVVHCAADVNFNRPLADSAAINISPALQLQALASQWPSCRRFVHCSTAFVNPGPGSENDPMREALFDLGKYDPQDLYDSMQGDQKLALQVKEEFGFPNNYVLTKCVAEHLVTRNNKSDQIELKIVRPAIVGPAWLLPQQGWNGDKPSTITGVTMLWGARVIRCAPLIQNKPMPVVPVDVVAACIIHALIAPPSDKVSKKEGSEEFPVTYRNLIWSHKSPKKFIDGIELARESMQVSQMLGHFSGIETAVCWTLLDIVDRFPPLYNIVHTIFNLGPLYLLQFVCWTLKVLGIKTILEKVPLVKLFNFSDLLTLYKPYMGREYHFESSINVPDSLSVHRYYSALLVATRNFLDKFFPGTVPELKDMNILRKGRLDLLWALTHPCRSFADRIAMYFASQILRASCDTMMVDFYTVDSLCSVLLEREKTNSGKKNCVVLTPDHNSALDYILIKYISFASTSLGIDIPVVMAKNEFADPSFSKQMSQVKSKSGSHSTLAAFLQGSPSTDEHLQKLDTAVLEKICENGGDMDFIFVPISMGYNSVSESEVFLKATKNGSDLGFFDLLALYWQICVLKNGKPASSLGDVVVKFGTPYEVNSGSKVEYKGLATELQKELRRISSS